MGANPGRSKTNAVTIAYRERTQRAVKLRASGLSYAQVMSECGYPSEDSARKSVTRFMAKEDQGARDEARAIQRERIETLIRSLWLAAINPGMAQQAARQVGHPAPPDQARAVELLIRLLGETARVEGLYAPIRAEMSRPAGRPLEGRLNVMHWTPDAEFMVRYAKVLKEAGLLDADAVEDEVRYLDPGAGDPRAGSDRH